MKHWKLKSIKSFGEESQFDKITKPSTVCFLFSFSLWIILINYFQAQTQINLRNLTLNSSSQSNSKNEKFFSFVFKLHESQYNEIKNKTTMNFHPKEEEEEPSISVNLKDCFNKYIELKYSLDFFELNEFSSIKFQHFYPHMIYSIIHYLGGIVEFMKSGTSFIL